MKPVTVGLIVGNRGFFPSHLCEKGREEMIQTLEDAGFKVIIMDANETVSGSVESLEEAHKYAEENVRINKLSHKIVLINGDVRDVARKYFGMFDRVIMPLPFGAESFIDIAVECLKKEGGIIHFYYWAHESDLYSEAIRIVKKYAEKYNRKIKVLDKRIVSPYAPRVYKIAIDFLVK